MRNPAVPKQILALILSTVLLGLDTGCTVRQVKKLDTSKVAQPQQEHIVGVTTKTGEEVGFDPPGGNVDHNTIVAKVRMVPYSIAIQDVQRLWVERNLCFQPYWHKSCRQGSRHLLCWHRRFRRSKFWISHHQCDRQHRRFRNGLW